MNRKQCSKKKKEPKHLCKIWGWCLESLMARACNQGSTPFSLFDLSASVKHSVKWVFIHVQEEPNNSLFSFSLCFHVYWVTIGLFFFFLVPSPTCHLVQHPHCSKPLSPLCYSDLGKQPLEFGQVACANVLELLVFGFWFGGFCLVFFFYLEAELLKTSIILALHFKLWIFPLFLFYICFTLNT